MLDEGFRGYAVSGPSQDHRGLGRIHTDHLRQARLVKLLFVNDLSFIQVQQPLSRLDGDHDALVIDEKHAGEKLVEDGEDEALRLQQPSLGIHGQGGQRLGISWTTRYAKPSPTIAPAMPITRP